MNDYRTSQQGSSFLDTVADFASSVMGYLTPRYELLTANADGSTSRYQQSSILENLGTSFIDPRDKIKIKKRQKQAKLKELKESRKGKEPAVPNRISAKGKNGKH